MAADVIERVVNGQQCPHCGQDLVATYRPSPDAPNVYHLDGVHCRGGCAVSPENVDDRYLLLTVQR